MCIVMVLCHGGTANRRYSTSKGNCQVQDKRGKALQGMTAGCTHRPHKTVLFIFSSVCFSLCSHQSEHVSLLLCVVFLFVSHVDQNQGAEFESHFNNSTCLALDCVRGVIAILAEL